MIESAKNRSSHPAESDLFDPRQVEMMLNDLICWPEATRPGNVMVERCWPTRDNGLAFEWSFDLGRRGRRVLFGTTGLKIDKAGGPCFAEACDTSTGLRGIFVPSPEWGVLIHTPDRDPAMPHLLHCLDGIAMTARLRPFWMWLDGQNAAPPSGLLCRLLGYRPRRRATIEYHARTPHQTPSTLVGKTHVNNRTQQLRRTHEQLNAELSEYSRGRVRSPACLGEVPDLRMALFSEARGRELGDDVRWSSRQLDRVVSALTALHQCRIDDAVVFSVVDELCVTRRWHELMTAMRLADAGSVEPLLDGLLRLSEQFDPTPQCLVHRDFYGRQIIIGRHTTTILDLDTLAWGQPCVDLGNLLAHVLQAGLLRAVDRGTFEALAEELIQRYEQISVLAVNRKALAFYFASALFRVGAVHALRTRSCRTSLAMWGAAADAIRSASDAQGGSRFRFLEANRLSLRLPAGSNQATCRMEVPL